jgi:superfamily II DNA helicase RecQ
MGKKVHRVPYSLDPGEIKDLPFDEIKAILRGADDLIMQGGRSLLFKVLKGSRENRVIELGLNISPVYGFYKDLALDEVKARIDWVILSGFLDIEYDYRLPMLVYTEKGWDIEKETRAEEFLEEFEQIIEIGSTDFDMNYLKDRNRGMILLLLDKVEATREEKFIPILEAWEKVDYKKVRKRIREVINTIESVNEFRT